MFEPALGRLVLGRDAVCVDRLVCWFALCDRWRSTDRSRFHSVRSSGFGVVGGGFLTASGLSETSLA